MSKFEIPTRLKNPEDEAYLTVTMATDLMSPTTPAAEGLRISVSDPLDIGLDVGDEQVVFYEHLEVAANPIAADVLTDLVKDRMSLYGAGRGDVAEHFARAAERDVVESLDLEKL